MNAGAAAHCLASPSASLAIRGVMPVPTRCQATLAQVWDGTPTRAQVRFKRTLPTRARRPEILAHVPQEVAEAAGGAQLGDEPELLLLSDYSSLSTEETQGGDGGWGLPLDPGSYMFLFDLRDLWQELLF